MSVTYSHCRQQKQAVRLDRIASHIIRHAFRASRLTSDILNGHEVKSARAPEQTGRQSRSCNGAPAECLPERSTLQSKPLCLTGLTVLSNNMQIALEEVCCLQMSSAPSQKAIRG